MGLSAAIMAPAATMAAVETTNIDNPETQIISVTTRSGDATKLSRMDLAALPQTAFTTTFPWSKTPRRLEGPSIADLVDRFDPERRASTIEFVALDAYLVSTEIDRLVRDEALLALRQDGAYLPVADKGPALLMFPFTDRPELDDKAHGSLCIWQIVEIRLV